LYTKHAKASPNHQVVFLFALVSQVVTTQRSYGKGKRLYVFPGWAIAFGWLLSMLPLLFLPGLVLANVVKFRRKGKVGVLIV
jgi:hypothetical protein